MSLPSDSGSDLLKLQIIITDVSPFARILTPVLVISFYVFLWSSYDTVSLGLLSLDALPLSLTVTFSQCFCFLSNCYSLNYSVFLILSS